jgi:hypothetical protein
VYEVYKEEVMDNFIDNLAIVILGVDAALLSVVMFLFIVLKTRN